MSNKIINSPIERTTRKLFSMVIERLAVVISKESLSFSQVAALHIIDREGFININDISNKLNLSVSATSRMIDELVKKEFVVRKEDPKNRRVKILSLSPNDENFMNNISIERVKIIRQSANLIADKLKIIKNSKGGKK